MTDLYSPQHYQDMVEGRVVSKNLFSFLLTGVVDPGVLEAESKWKGSKASPEAAAAAAKYKEVSEREDDESTKEYLVMIRNMMSQGFMEAFTNYPEYNEAPDRCESTTKFEVPTSHHGEHDVPVEVYTPKSLSGQRERRGRNRWRNRDLRWRNRDLR